MSLLDIFRSSNSLTSTMVNAMLEDVDLKSSQPDLTSQPDLMIYGNIDGEGKSSDSLKSLEVSPVKRNTESRSVVIQVPEPKKRKLDPSVTARRLVNDISVSATLNDRLAVLLRTNEFLDHNFVSEHDDEIRFDLDVALVKQLIMLVLKLSRCRSNMLVPVEEETLEALIEEITSTLEGLEMLYRASDNAVGESFQKIGIDLLHVLTSVMDEELNRRITQKQPKQQSQPVPVPVEDQGKDHFKPIQNEDLNDATKPAVNATLVDDVQEGERPTGTPELLQRPTSPDTIHLTMGTPQGNHLILKAIKVMGHLARVGKATKPMAFFPGLLHCMLNLINYQPYESIPWEARLSALWILGNLACNPENMQMMICTPGLVRSLVRVGCRALHPADPMEITMDVLRSRSLSSRALLNLSWKPENKIPLAENWALVELLTQLAVHRKAPTLNKSKTVQQILQQTRCHAVGGLRNLAAAPRRTKIQLCDYRNGHVLDALTDVALNDTDPAIQIRALAAIHNLAIHDTAPKMVERPALVLALKDVLLEEPPPDQPKSQQDGGGKEGSARGHASATLMVLERSITPEMPTYQSLRDLLDAVNPTVAEDEDEDDPGSDVKNVASIAV